MQILIGIGIATCGIIVGFIISSLITTGKAENTAKEWVRCCIKSLDSGEITIEDLRNYIEE